MAMEICTWCGAEVEPEDGFRAYEPAGERRAVFCRLEHVIPWSIQGPHWDNARVLRRRSRGATRFVAKPPVDNAPTRCSHCDAELTGAHVLLVRHRGEHRVADAFCSVDHMTEWAKAGGRWR
jgi:hypothetical protein